MKILKLAVCLLLFGAVSVSCTKEDHSNCYNTYQLAMQYNGDGDKDIFSTKINSVDMYVFDNMNTCVFHKTLSETDVKAQLTTLPQLDAGEYRIVCVGNAHSTQVQNLNAGDLSKIIFAANNYLNNSVVSTNDSLYWSAVNYTIEPYSEYMQPQTRTTCFASSHYDVYVEVENMPEHMAQNLKIELVGVSPYTDFHNKATGTPTTYILNTLYDGANDVKAWSNIMRHKNHEDVYLRVSGEDNVTIAQVNFADHIAKNSSYINTDLHECLIPFQIVFGDNDLDVTIQFPKWMIEYITPEF